LLTFCAFPAAWRSVGTPEPGGLPPQLPQLLFTALFAEKKKAGFILSRQMLKSKFKREPDAKIVSETDLLSGI
jgi:hypothetical protein